MTAQVLTLRDVLIPDAIGMQIAQQWVLWQSLRQEKIVQWEEVRKYKYAVDTTTTTNSQLPWKNKTTYPKLTQIADNLKANYLMSLFPRRKWLIWEGSDDQSNMKAKTDAIEQYMMSVVEYSDFYNVMGLLLDDWIDFGNCFSTVKWVDERVKQPNSQISTGYVGPCPVRISPFDIVFNPIADSFANAPKIVRKFVTLGDLKSEIEMLSPSTDEAEKLWDYIYKLRHPNHAAYGLDTAPEDMFFQVDGFTSFQQYLGSDYAEILTFYGDIFIRESGEFYKNAVVTVVDRHKMISNVPNPSIFGRAPIYQSTWRARQDNLWGMGPLDNLVGMQYRIDHLENLKADVFDLNAFPPIKVKGLVNDDFDWAPMERIYIGDDGDVEMVAPNFQILNTNNEIDALTKRMEDIAGAPAEAMGIRSPGEKTKYEVQRLENAAGRIFQTRLLQFENQQVEQNLTALLELARRKMVTSELRMYDSDLKIATFQSITTQDIMGNGRVRPVAAKHFAEQADRVQNLTAFANSSLGQDPAINVHISGLKMAQLFEELLEIQQYKIIQPFVRISEQHEATNLQQAAAQQQQAQNGAPGGNGSAPGAPIPGSSGGGGGMEKDSAPGLPGISNVSPLAARGGGPKVPLIRAQLSSNAQQGAPLATGTGSAAPPSIPSSNFQGLQPGTNAVGT